MSQASSKAPKPFLKKGTRQFLSNATVRSLNQKPNLFQFEQNPQETQMPIRNGPVKDIPIEIKINHKPKIKQEDKRNNDTLQKSKQNQVVNDDRQSSAKKKTVLNDYLPSSSKNTTNNKATAKVVPPPSVPKIGTMTGMLKRQDQQIASDQSDESPAPKQTKNSVYTNKPVVQARLPPTNISIKQKPQIQPEQQQNIKFQSDSEQQNAAKTKKPSIMPTQIKPKITNPTVKAKIQSKNKWSDQEQPQENNQQETGPNKILQKYYKKAPEVQNKQKITKQSQNKPLTISDIPQTLKDAIFLQKLQQTKNKINSQFANLQQIKVKLHKQKDQWQQQNKKLQKQRQNFQKQIILRQKQFQQKIKNQTSKISRQKMYLKQKQTSGKVDYSIKSQLEEIKKRLQESQAQKKKIKVDLTREVDRLKKKVDEQQQQNKSLIQQIKYIQKERVQVKEKVKIAQQAQKKKIKQNFWKDAPASSFLSTAFDDDFSLMDTQAFRFSYQQIQYYQYYKQQVDQPDELVSQQIDPTSSKIVRKYKSGKEEYQLAGKLLKQSFPAPFKFVIVHHNHGDIKIVTPEGVHIYFDNKNQITQFDITPQKKIYNFHNLGQVELKFRHRIKGQIHQLASKDLVVRRSKEGEERFKRGSNGSWSQI